jgi:hypothetical protein
LTSVDGKRKKEKPHCKIESSSPTDAQTAKGIKACPSVRKKKIKTLCFSIQDLSPLPATSCPSIPQAQ